jgi:hypothetical protein
MALKKNRISTGQSEVNFLHSILKKMSCLKKTRKNFKAISLLLIVLTFCFWVENKN